MSTDNKEKYKGKTRQVCRLDMRAGMWRQINFSDIKMYDVLRMYEPDNSMVEDDRGNIFWVAKTDCYVNEDGIETFDMF